MTDTIKTPEQIAQQVITTSFELEDIDTGELLGWRETLDLVMDERDDDTADEILTLIVNAIDADRAQREQTGHAHDAAEELLFTDVEVEGGHGLDTLGPVAATVNSGTEHVSFIFTRPEHAATDEDACPFAGVLTFTPEQAERIGRALITHAAFVRSPGQGRD